MARIAYRSPITVPGLNGSLMSLMARALRPCPSPIVADLAQYVRRGPADDRAAVLGGRAGTVSCNVAPGRRASALAHALGEAVRKRLQEILQHGALVGCNQHVGRHARGELVREMARDGVAVDA